MDNILSDELLQEIFTKLPPPPPPPPPPSSPPSSWSSQSVSLVSKRWLYLYRTSRTALSLCISPQESITPSLSTFLSHHPFLSSLSVHLSSFDPTTESSIPTTTSPLSDYLLFMVATYGFNLKRLNFLAAPLSSSSLLYLSSTCTNLTSLTVSQPRPLLLDWVSSFPCLNELSVYICSTHDFNRNWETVSPSNGFSNDSSNEELGLENLTLSGIGPDDTGVNFLWRNSRKIKKLQLQSCESIGDGVLFSSFIKHSQNLETLELRKSRSIVDKVLLKLSRSSLNSLLIHDGGSSESLLHYINDSRCCDLRKLDLRLPLDLRNDHLSAMATKFRNLSILRLQSCSLVTGEGLKAIATSSMSTNLKELGLITCDAVQREPGLLTALVQSLKELKKLDLSYNELLFDKEITSMMVASCDRLIELRLKGCKGLTGKTMVSLSMNCKGLEVVDVMWCCGIEVEAVEVFVMNSLWLRKLEVEESKVSDAARVRASSRSIRVGSVMR